MFFEDPCSNDNKYWASIEHTHPPQYTIIPPLSLYTHTHTHTHTHIYDSYITFPSSGYVPYDGLYVLILYMADDIQGSYKHAHTHKLIHIHIHTQIEIIIII